MDINLLKTFLEVMKTRNFARAAENLYVTSAAVSARIKQLESQLGVSLFTRTRSSTSPTNEAERLLPLAETMINTWARAVQEVSLQPSMETRIHIGATASLWRLAIEQRLLAIRAQLPEIALQVEAHSNETLARLLEDQTLDLVLLPDPYATEEFCSEKIGAQNLVLGATFAGDFAAAKSQPYVYVDWGTAFAGFHAERIGERLKPGLHANMASIAQVVIEAEGGSAYLPLTMVEASEELQVVEGAPGFKRPIYACYRRENVSVDTIRELVRQLKKISL